MSKDDALFHGECLFWAAAALIIVVGSTQSYLLPLWANACLVVAFMICTHTPRKLKNARMMEDA